MKLSTIPFHGFYESIHSMLIEDEVNSAFSDASGCEVNQNLVDRAWDYVDYSAIRDAYSREYANHFALETGINCAFESLKSPREYNFMTDVIYINIAEAEVLRLYNEVDTAAMTAHCVDTFTSRDGFSSFYNADWTTWGDVMTWDHNQVGALVEVYSQQVTDGFESDLGNEGLCSIITDNMTCNGGVSEAVYSGMASDKCRRLLDIQSYLVQREERVA